MEFYPSGNILQVSAALLLETLATNITLLYLPDLLHRKLTQLIWGMQTVKVMVNVA